MAEQEQPKGEPAITREALQRYLDARGIDGNCPICKANDWGMVMPEALEGVALSRLGGDALVYPDSILPTLVLSCNNCSYLWMIARKQVARWLAENPT